VRTDRGQGDSVGAWVDDRATARQVVSCATGWRRDQDTVTLDNCKQDVVDVDVETAHELSVAASDRDLIERVANRGLNLFASLAVDEHALEVDE